MATQVQSMGDRDETDLTIIDDTHQQKWTVFGRKVPRSEFVFISQVLAVYIVIIASIINLSTSTERKELWTSLLSACIGYLLPAPKIKQP